MLISWPYVSLRIRGNKPLRDMSLHFAQVYQKMILSALQTCLCTSLRVTRIWSSLLYRHVFALRSGLPEYGPLCFTDMSLHFSQGYQNMVLSALQTCPCASLRFTRKWSSLLYRHVFALRSGLPEYGPLCITDMSLHFVQGYQNMVLSALQTCLCTSLRVTRIWSSLLYRHVFALRSGLPEYGPLCFTDMSFHFAEGYQKMFLSALQTCLCTSLRATLICSSVLHRHVFALR